MKKLLFLLALSALSGRCAAQSPVPAARLFRELPLVNGKVSYEALRPVCNTARGELASRAAQWARDNQALLTPDTAQTTQTPDVTTLVLRGQLEQPPRGAFKDRNSYTFICTVQAKDGKYRYAFNQFQWTYSLMNIAGEAVRGPLTYSLENMSAADQQRYTASRAEYLNGQIEQLIKTLNTAMTHDEQLTW
ncbi:hypothetical protein KLP40_12115 [Hymenobacter sp. NST-14]|uniref:hypothetical protein n=1 Tax=Hymenobacter piscis TaxID=2839984 RepID=UPI001C026FE6|nr:hypothetical protein [Hymenobacter piscis]MBT9393909.1 hypothetical protein [Hymenobacter piscis]